MKVELVVTRKASVIDDNREGSGSLETPEKRSAPKA